MRTTNAQGGRRARARGWWLAAIASIVAAGQAWALDPERSVYQYNCQTWRRSNGLPANAVTAIAQTNDRRLWLGTFQGLVSFDGVAFRTLDNLDANKAITSLASRQDLGLWIGLDRGGLQGWDRHAVTPMRGSQWDGPFSTVRALTHLRDGRLLVGGINIAGILSDEGEFTELMSGEAIDVFSVHEDQGGRIWLGTAKNGLLYVEDGVLKEFPSGGLEQQVISAVAVDPEGNIWVGTANGLRCFNRRFEEVKVPEFTSQPKAVLVDRHGVVWIGTVASGLIRHWKGEYSTLRKREGLASDRILSLAELDDGSLWVGTEDGVSQLSDVKFPILSIAEGLAHEACLSVTAGRDGSLWAATPNGLSQLVNGTFVTYGHENRDGFTSRWLKEAHVARDGDVYVIGAAKNIDRVRNGQVVQTLKFDSWPTTLAEDSRGLIVALGDTLMRIEGEEVVPMVLADGSPVSLRWIHHMIVTEDDAIWVAAVDGVLRIKDGVLRNLCHENAVYQSSFYYLTEDDHGAVWAAQNTGISRFKEGKMRSISQADGLHDNSVHAIVPDRLGGVWMDSSRGIFRVDEKELNAVADGGAERVICRVFDGEDVVKTNDKSAPVYSGCRTADGRVWFPSSQGVIMIDPAKASGAAAPPAVFLERVLIDGREHAVDREPELKPTAGNLEFGYTALDYRAPQKVRYRYRLVGIDETWVDAGGRRSAFYTNVRHGRYRFDVQACNADGVWNTTGASFALTLPPRYYETLWFRLACGAGFLGLCAYAGWMLHLRRKHAQLEHTRELLEIKVRERTAELTAEIEERKKMQQEVERVHRELIDISRQAGMAEVATGVLHNVGNVLTSVNVSTTLLSERIRDSKARWVDSLRDLVKENEANLGRFFSEDPRGRQVPEFLERLSAHLASERAELVREVEALSKNVEHIKDIVVMQQNYATVLGVSEKVGLVELVEDALRMNSSAFERHELELVRDFQTNAVVVVEKHKVLQILINLLRNAKYACDDSGRTDKRITVRVTAEGERAFVAVIDNGVGIPEENLTRIFSFGFTTRKSHGHGFGLHNGALAAKNLGGSLTVRSDGPGRGAQFILELPLTKPAAT